MTRLAGIILAAVLFGFMFPALAVETMTEADMDQVTAGNFGGDSSTILRTINMGRYSLVFDGARWTRVATP